MSCARKSLNALLASVACAALAGCGVTGGGGAGAPGRHVTISVLAPMSGATVGVRTVQIAGSVSPAGAAVRVDGQPATVHGNSFNRSVTLGPGTTAIPVTAGAKGWAQSSVTVTVHYSPGLALALSAARATALAGPPASLSRASAAAGTGGGATAGVSFVPTVNLSPSAGAGSPSAGASHNITPTAPSPTPSTPAPTTPAPRPPTGAAPTGSVPTTTTPTPTAPPQPPLNAPLSQSQMRSAYLAGCVQSAGTHKAKAYCTCTYKRIARAGGLRTRARILGLMRRVKRFERTGNLSVLPKWFLHAVLACVSKLPPPSLKLHHLPGLHHPAAAGPAGAGTAGAGTPAPGQTTTPPAPGHATTPPAPGQTTTPPAAGQPPS
ncbi:MAG: hypothetical protein ACYCXW_12600 [Solirubrobacteraceae bacterium]